eukprot:3792596-Prymnesium_polylepis.1
MVPPPVALFLPPPWARAPACRVRPGRFRRGFPPLADRSSCLLPSCVNSKPIGRRPLYEWVGRPYQHY